jgi:hypothetical protein
MFPLIRVYQATYINGKSEGKDTVVSVHIAVYHNEDASGGVAYPGH